MTNQKKIGLLENMVMQYGGSDQLLHLQTCATNLQLSDEEYLDYLCCYLKKVIRQ